MASLPIAVRSTPKIAKGAFQRRTLSDVVITRTGKPIIRTQGGRSSLGGHTATVFGATGALGRYIVNRLARQGCTVVIPYREEMAKRHLKVTGDLGRVVFMEYDLHNTESIEESVRHSDVVYNLVGRDYPTKNFSLEDVHVEGAERIAEAVAKYDVDRFIHVSSHSADESSPSEFYATKARGEKVVRSIFPETTIVRPAPMFGFEDNLLLKLAGVTNLFTSNNMQERYWPVHVIDVGEALEVMLYDDTTASQTYELYGPKNYSTAEIAEMVDREIFKKRRHINIPKKVLKPVAGLINKALWWPILSSDQVEREFHDQVIDESAKTFKDLGIEPGDISKFTYHYLQGFRSSSFYDLPPATEKEKREERKYIHVLDDQQGNPQKFCLTLSDSRPNKQPTHSRFILASLYHAGTHVEAATFSLLHALFTMTKMDSDDDSLSSGALDALKAFYAERDAREQEFAKLELEAEQRRTEYVPLSMDTFVEDWNKSQFWYDDETAGQFARYLLKGSTDETTIAIVSVPSVFVALKNIIHSDPDTPKPKVVFLEYDQRFAIFPEFVFYDFQQPFKLPGHLKGSIDCIISDPPFLSEDCQTKVALTVRWLMRSASLPATLTDTAAQVQAKSDANPRIIVCTGERMAPLVNKLYKAYGVQTTDYEPKHARGLSNEFWCYANFESEIWHWRPEDAKERKEIEEDENGDEVISAS
ncbi:putative N6-adenine methyltransferase-domain-containing protein [Podospora didyma]|uniref:Protein-lysine N-methyltransferase EFM5 n=1 Tax=Podospora didyma TaxID=330526 RepID=A0AAE0NNT7_9PEZI|nr:putative N6-adenine methyltransferase-domain-containing protein [Podospora didyma]